MKRTFILAVLAALMAVSAQGIGDSSAKTVASDTAVTCPDEGCTPCPFPCDTPCDTACPMVGEDAS